MASGRAADGDNAAPTGLLASSSSTRSPLIAEGAAAPGGEEASSTTLEPGSVLPATEAGTNVSMGAGVDATASALDQRDAGVASSSPTRSPLQAEGAVAPRGEETSFTTPRSRSRTLPLAAGARSSAGTGAAVVASAHRRRDFGVASSSPSRSGFLRESIATRAVGVGLDSPCSRSRSPRRDPAAGSSASAGTMATATAQGERAVGVASSASSSTPVADALSSRDEEGFRLAGVWANVRKAPEMGGLLRCPNLVQPSPSGSSMRESGEDGGRCTSGG